MADQQTPVRPGFEDVPLPPTTAHRNLRQAFVCVGVCTLMLFAFEGVSLLKGGKEMKPGWQRTMVVAAGEPSSWVATKTGLHELKRSLVGWARTDGEVPTAPHTANAGKPVSKGQLGTIVVTGDSMAQPLDAKLAQKFTSAGSSAAVVSDVHLGTAISQPELLDWVAAAKKQEKKWHPSAVVVLLGANEGFPLSGPDGNPVSCCGAGWVALYAARAGKMMDQWTAGGKTQVYWLTLPTPRDNDRREISDAVNGAIVAAAQRRSGRVRIVDLNAIFTPGDRFRASMSIGGRSTVVREPDGVHLNEAGAEHAVTPVLEALRQDFADQVPR